MQSPKAESARAATTQVPVSVSDQIRRLQRVAEPCGGAGEANVEGIVGKTKIQKIGSFQDVMTSGPPGIVGSTKGSAPTLRQGNDV